MLGTSFVLCGIQSTIKKYVVLLVVACANRVFVIKTSLNGEEKLLGTKNMLDHIKNCTPSSSSSVTRSSDGVTSSISTAVCPKNSWPEVPGQFC